MAVLQSGRWRLENLARRLPSPAVLGVIGSALIALGSFGAGATRNRGGLLEALDLEFLTFGHGAGMSAAVLWVGILVLLLSWVLLGRSAVVDSPADDAARTATVRRSLVAWVAPLVVAAPILSRDVYSYLMQGAMVRDGFDPYSEGAAVNPGPYLLEVSHDWRNTTTPYGPLHLWMGSGVTGVVGDNVAAGLIVYKLISLAGFTAIAWAVPRIARRLGGDPAMALWLGVANPVMVLHLVGGMHNESVMVGLVSVGLLACLRRRFILGTALIAVAVALKATAAIALPFVVWMATNHYAGDRPTWARRAVAFVATGAAGVAVTLAVISAVTWLSGSSWGWLQEISGNSKVINPLAGPTLLTELTLPFIQLFAPSFDYNVLLGVFRPLGTVLMLTGLVVVWWLFRQDDRRAVMGTTLAYQVAFMTNSVTLPWYYASVVSLAGTFTPPRWVLKLTVGASVFLTLSFEGSGNHQLYNLAWVAASLILAWVLTVYVFPLDAHLRPGLDRSGDAAPGTERPASVTAP
ncbi:hypothetical protein B841_08855 [Corynebacterium maris DSM 45190]|uniref:Alpha-(1->6)-mannopyranosyltransferase A n=1 Tax=Corynebacterium maris DSM 45190 TaxID=1224163 RepID=S5SVK0_9CORY|nr:alpha-(1->6)-mannopyranosyltransferase A [Corynebacterium maris]AGS35244.1 hypothetical protein B841_08855 [Corynebacterium maris DSM 45190]